MRSRVVIVANPPLKVFALTYPLGVAYLAAVLKQNQFEVRVVDYANRSISARQAAEDIAESYPDFVGFSIFTVSYNITKQVIFELKRIYPQIKIIIGGHHVSVLPEFSLQDLGADFAVVGEGEYVLPDVLKRINSGSISFDDIKGLAYWKEGERVFNSGCNIVENLDSIPFPAWDLVPLAKYPAADGNILIREEPVATVVTSRGCPYYCSFCASHAIHGRIVRKRSAINVAAEIELLKSNHGIKEIHFFDDAFTEDQRHALGVCEGIIKNSLNISWRTGTGIRLDTVNDDLLQAFKQSGCYMVSFGIESFSDKVLNCIRKPLRKQEIIDKVEMIKKHKIKTWAYFILGLPGDSEATVKETIKFAASSNIDYVTFTLATPLPGSEIFNNYFKDYPLHSINWANLHYFSSSPYNISKLSNRSLKLSLILAYFYTYFNSKRIKNTFIDIMYSKKIKLSKLFKVIHDIIKSLF